MRTSADREAPCSSPSYSGTNTILSFKKHHPPFADFLVAAGADQVLRNTMLALGATLIEKPGHNVYLWGFPKGNVLFAGFGVLNERLEHGPLSLSHPPERRGVGSFVVLDLRRDVTHIYADRQGSHVLYSGSGLVTNRLHLAAIARRRIDYSSALATVHSNHMFSQQFGVLKTPVLGLSMALPGDEFKVDRVVTTALRVSPNGDDNSTALDAPAYHRLVERGAAEIVRNVESIIDGSLPVLCDLTGGQDSRVLLAALVATGRVKDVVFNTAFSETGAQLTATVSEREAIRRERADLEIASGLLNRFGGAFQPRPRAVRYETSTFRDNLDRHRSQRFGSYHFLTSGLLQSVIPTLSTPCVRMTGGSGELYRDYYQRFFKSVEAHELFDPAAIRPMLLETHNQAFPIHLFEHFVPRYTETFEQLPGRTVGCRMDSHYRTFRNRFHFGTNTSAPWSSTLSISPLNSPSLLLAAAGLPEHEKATGRVLFDVTKALCEVLAYFPYDKPKSDKWLESPYHKRSRYDDHPPSLEPSQELIASRLSSPVGKSIPKPKAEPRVDLKEWCRQSVIASLDRLSDDGCMFQDLSTEAFVRYIESERTPPTRIASWASRLQAFVDYTDVGSLDHD